MNLVCEDGTTIQFVVVDVSDSYIAIFGQRVPLAARRMILRNFEPRQSLLDVRRRP